jgi:hypothetical protein
LKYPESYTSSSSRISTPISTQILDEVGEFAYLQLVRPMEKIFSQGL